MSVPFWMSLLSEDELACLTMAVSHYWFNEPMGDQRAHSMRELNNQLQDEARTRQRVCEALAGPPRPWLP